MGTFDTSAAWVALAERVRGLQDTEDFVKKLEKK